MRARRRTTPGDTSTPLTLCHDPRNYFSCAAHQEAFDEERHGAPRMGEDPGDIGVTGGRTAENQIRNRAGRVGLVFDERGSHPWHEVTATIPIDGMHEDHGFSPVQFLIDRGERFMA